MPFANLPDTGKAPWEVHHAGSDPDNQRVNNAHRYPEIVLTGGPSGGKSSAMAYLSEHLSRRGWRVLIVPEAATLLITGGIRDIGHLAAVERPTFLGVQEHLIALQNDLRARYHALASRLTHHQPDAKIVILHDRAELDNRAYLSADEFTKVLAATTRATPGEIAGRYDAVLHLTTAAAGDGYTTENNEARTESADQALTLDKATLNAWLGHPHLNVIGNEADFEKKLTRVLAAVLNVLGEPEPVEVERKWLLASPPSDQMLARAVPVEIEQIYLPHTDGVERRVRARTHDGHTIYFHTTKQPSTSGHGRVEHETRIDAETYRLLAGMRDPATQVLRKRRYCFVDGDQHFELDRISAPIDLWLLEAELISAGDEVSVPDGLHIAREVTDSPEWSNRAIAQTSPSAT